MLKHVGLTIVLSIIFRLASMDQCHLKNIKVVLHDGLGLGQGVPFGLGLV